VARAAVLVLLVALLSSCGPPTLDALRAATVVGVASEPVTLANGRYERSPESGARLLVTLSTEHVAVGEVAGLRGETAVAVVSATTGGSGGFVYLAAFQQRAGRAASIGTVLLGDRVQVVALGIVDAKVTVDVVAHGAGDARCCPSQLARKSYAFRDASLVLETSTVTGTLSLAQLGGREWTLVRMEGEPLAQGARAPTVAFAQARLSGFGGCNRYTGTIHETTPGRISLAQLAATRMACAAPAMELEDRYFAAMRSVSHYAVAAGRLVLTGADGAAVRRLTFERAP
jgi:heat shock protein HslJ